MPVATTVRLVYNTSMGEHWNMSVEGRSKISAYAKKRYKDSTTIVKCSHCSNKYKVSYIRLENGRGKYCSRVCKGLDTRGKRVAPETEFKKGAAPWNRGKSYSLKTGEERIGKFTNCIVCSKRFKEQPNRKNLHCSLACKKQFKIINGKGIKTNDALKIWRENGGIPSNYKGDEVGYGALHAWVRRHKGTPSLCSHCGTTESKRFEWCNVDGKYRRKLVDYIRLCKKCHNNYDGVNIWQQKTK